MIHTVAITYTHHNPQIYRQQINGIKAQKKLSKEARITYAYEELGFEYIIFYLTTLTNDEGVEIPQYTIYIKLDLPKLCGYGLVNRIRAKDLTDTIPKNFDEYIGRINDNLPKFNEWKVKRIDYSIDIKVKYPDLYIVMFQKGDMLRSPYKKIYSKTGHRRTNLPGSVYYTCKSKTVNFYHKYDQLSKKKNLPDDWQDTKDIKNIVRLEVQINDIGTIKKAFNITVNQLQYFLDPLIAMKPIKKAYKDIAVNEGDYHTLDEAKHLIEKSNFSQEDKDDMEFLLLEIARARSVAKYKADNPRSSIVDLIKKLETLNINPMCISQSQQRKYHLKTLPSLYGRITVDIDKRFMPIEETRMERLAREILGK